ncbi:MAG TPA: hypothetical protein VJT74_15945 [Pyrinomonadaceae bacterium]|nr:hypothetical protein [Pyrinomonadaceae bacterium]
MSKLTRLILCICLAATSLLAAPPDRKFDEFDFRDCESLIARLDNFAVSINSYPEAIGLVYVYGGKVSRKGEVSAYSKIIRKALEKQST